MTYKQVKFEKRISQLILIVKDEAGQLVITGLDFVAPPTSQ